MKLLFLGTGAAGGVTGNPLGDPNIRRCSSTLVDGELLLDPGPHIFDFAEQYGNPDLYAGVRYILCTHSHWLRSFNSSVTPSAFFICSIKSSNISTACFSTSAQC